MTLARRIAPWWLPPAIMSPSFVWLALDRSVWPWDQAWFAAHSLSLYQTLRHEPLAWFSALAATTPIKPPMVAWIGQFFVPAGWALGSIDAGLRLSIWACHLAALILVLRSLLDLSGGRTGAATAGVLVMGAAPLFMVLSTQYLAEAAQTLAVAWFVFVMSRAPRWSRSMLAAQLVAATSFAMLAKSTSPVYCALPGLVALFHMVARAPMPSESRRDRRSRAWLWWALALALATAASVWHAHNFGAVLMHTKAAAFGPVAELYGKRAGFMDSFGYWCKAAARVFFLQPVAVLAGTLVVLGAAKRLSGRPVTSLRYLDTCAGAALLQVGVALSTFTLASNRDPRYLAPLLPLVAVILSWPITQAGTWAAAVATLALTTQLALVHAQFFGIWLQRPSVLQAVPGVGPASITVLNRDDGPARELAAIVMRTCGHGTLRSDNYMGVELLHLNAHSLTHAAAKARLASHTGECHYHTLALQTVADVQWHLGARDFVYWVAVDPAVRPVPPEFAFLNQTSPIVFRQLRRRGILQPEPWNGPQGVLLFRFVKR